jgi:hypothetical protein
LPLSSDKNGQAFCKPITLFVLPFCFEKVIKQFFQSNRKEKTIYNLHSCLLWLDRECEILDTKILVSLTKTNQFFLRYIFLRVMRSGDNQTSNRTKIDCRIRTYDFSIILSILNYPPRRSGIRTHTYRVSGDRFLENSLKPPNQVA